MKIEDYDFDRKVNPSNTIKTIENWQRLFFNARERKDSYSIALRLNCQSLHIPFWRYYVELHKNGEVEEQYQTSQEFFDMCYRDGEKWEKREYPGTCFLMLSKPNYIPKNAPLESGVEWCRWTWNPWAGCRHVSDGCKFCYAERELEGHWKKDFSTVKRTGANIWKKPYACNALINDGTPLEDRLMFTASFSDIFIKEADPFRQDFWQVVRDNKNVIFLILTKRIARAIKHLPSDWGDGYENVWIGTSVENQKQADLRLKHLKSIPAKIRFVSFEPLLEFVEYDASGIDWAIIGGESGNESGQYGYRPCAPYWIKHLVDLSIKKGVATFVKQMGTFYAKKANMSNRHGGDIGEFPDNLKFRQFPNFKFKHYD